MGLDFVKQVISIGGATTEPTLRFYRKGFNLGGSGGSQWQDIILSGNGSLTLANAKANGLNYLKLFGGCEQIASGNVGTAYIANTATEVTGDITNVPRTDISTPAVSLLKSGNITTGNISDIDWTKDWELLVVNTKITAINDIGNAISVCIDRSVAIQIYPYSGGKLCGACYIDGTQTSYSVDTITLNTNYDFRISYEERSGLRAIWIDYKLSSSDTWTPLLQKNITLTQPSVSYIGLSSRWNDKISIPINLSNVTFTNDGVVKYSSSASSTPTPDAPMDIVCNNGAIKVKDDELPVGYKRLLGITYDTSTYYETNQKLYGSDTLTLTVSDTSVSGRNLIGAYSGTGDNARNFSLFIYGSNSTQNCYLRHGTILSRPRLGSGERTISVTPTGTDGFLNDVTYSEETFETTSTFWIGGLPNSSSTKYDGNIEGNIIVINRLKYIPVERISDGAIGYYETFNSEFLENQGTGTPVSMGYDTSHLTEIYYDGTVETVTIKQAFVNDSDIVDRTGLNSSNGSAISNNSRCYVLFPCKAGVTYTAQTDTNDLIGGNFIEYNQPEATSTNFVKSLTIINDGLVDGVYKSHVVCDNDGWAGWQCKSNKETAMANNWQITSDISTATATNLLAVGDYKDVQEVKTGNVTRNVGVKVLDGTESWTQATTSLGVYRYRFEPTNAPKIDGSRGHCISTHFFDIGGVTTQDIGGVFASTTYLYFIPNQDVDTVEKWIAFLENQYNAGTPVIVVYPLATATTETVTAQPLSIQAGTNIVEITQASINNLPLEVSYKGTV